MKQPLMLTPARIPPAQAEALYDASLEEGAKRTADASADAWPGEDWEDEDAPLLRRAGTHSPDRPPPRNASSRHAA